jgi:hypothetical protein
MKAPWTDKTGLIRAVAILCTVLTIATGLCGLNAAFSWAGISSNTLLTQVVIITGFVELAAILLSAAALIIVLLLIVLKKLFNSSPGHKSNDDPPKMDLS